MFFRREQDWILFMMPIQMPPNEQNEDFVSIQVRIKSKAGKIWEGIFISVPSSDKPKN